jgi:hypothetical protein
MSLMDNSPTTEKNRNINNKNYENFSSCFAWSVTLREEHKLRVLRIYGPEREEVTGQRTFHNEELHNLYSLTRITRMIKLKMRSVEHVASMVRKLHTVLVEKSQGKRPCERPVDTREDITMDLKEIGWEGVHYIHLSQYKDQWQDLVNMVMNLQVA